MFPTNDEGLPKVPKFLSTLAPSMTHEFLKECFDEAVERTKPLREKLAEMVANQGLQDEIDIDSIQMPDQMISVIAQEVAFERLPDEELLVLGRYMMESSMKSKIKDINEWTVDGVARIKYNPENKPFTLQPEFGQRVKQGRLKLGLTIRELAEDAGVSESYISLIENGHREPPLAKAARICHALGQYISVGFAPFLGDHPLFRRMAKIMATNNNVWPDLPYVEPKSLDHLDVEDSDE